MSNQLIVHARHIRSDIRRSEDGFDLALANSARLVAKLLDTRREAGLPAMTARGTLGKALEAISMGAMAREKLLDVHEELAQLNIRAIGDLSECPEEWLTSASSSLTVVDSEAA
jgi:hypothetical protein